MKILKYFFSVLFFVVMIDSLFFKFLIWKLPNESPWGTNHFFNFEYEFKKIQSKKSSNRRILIVGSSIAYYSLDRDLLKNYIKDKTGEVFEVEYFSYAGMTPLDVFLCYEYIRKMNPALIVFPVNFIDYRIHRAYALNPDSPKFLKENELIRDALNFGEAPQSRFSFPFPALGEFWRVLGVERNAEYLAAGLFGFYRYREIFLPNLKNLYNHRFGRNTSYHGYAGVQIPERVSSLGWTGKSFSFYPTTKMKVEGFYIQLVPEIFSKGKLTLEIKNAKGDFQLQEFTKPGWTLVRLDQRFYTEKNLVTATLSNTWKPFEAKEDRFDHSKDELGVRLPQIFGLEEPLSDMQYVREERSEDLRYGKMSEEEYRSYFYYRLLDDFAHRPGIAYLHALKNTKVKLANEKFVPTLHLKYLKMFANLAEREGQKVLIINNPESPISMEWYSNSDWYRFHLKYLSSISGNNAIFIDLKDFLRVQDFSDFHHFTYPAMVKMNPVYGEKILRVLNLSN